MITGFIFFATFSSCPWCTTTVLISPYFCQNGYDFDSVYWSVALPIHLWDPDVGLSTRERELSWPIAVVAPEVEVEDKWAVPRD